MVRVFIAVGLVVVFLIVGLPVCGILFLLKRKDPVGASQKAQALAAGVLRMITGLIGIRYETRGLENIPKEGGLLFASNHRSYYDIVAAYCTVNRQVGFIAKNALWKALSLRRWMQLVNCYFLDRDDIRQGLEVIKAATERVKNGGCVWVCPEGTRNKSLDNTSLLEFHEASFKIAERGGVQIVPVAFYGTRERWERQFPKMLPGTITVIYGKPFYVKDLGPEWKKKTGAYTAERVKEMLLEEKARRENG